MGKMKKISLSVYTDCSPKLITEAVLMFIQVTGATMFEISTKNAKTPKIRRK